MTTWQLWVIVFFASFCVTPFGFVAVHQELAGEVWLASALQAVVCLTGAAGVALLARERPGLSLPAVAEEALGRWGAAPYLAAFMLFLFAWAPLGNMMTLLRIVHATALSSTPVWVLGAVLAGCAAYAVALGVSAYVRTAEALAFALLPAIVLIVMAGSFGRLQPGFLAVVPPAVPLSGSLFGFGLGARGFAVALALLGCWSTAGRPARSLYSATAGACVLVAMLYALPHLIFPYPALHRFEFPAVSALQTIDASFVGLSNFWPLTLVVWYGISWITVAGALTGAAHLARQWLGAPRRVSAVAMAFVSVVAVGRLVSAPAAGETALLVDWTVLGYATVVIGPFALWLALRIRERAAALAVARA